MNLQLFSDTWILPREKDTGLNFLRQTREFSQGVTPTGEVSLQEIFFSKRWEYLLLFLCLYKAMEDFIALVAQCLFCLFVCFFPVNMYSGIWLYRFIYPNCIRCDEIFNPLKTVKFFFMFRNKSVNTLGSKSKKHKGFIKCFMD